jgi:endonuclease VIII
VPEGDNIFRAARTLQLALAGRVVTRFEAAVAGLDVEVVGRVVERVEAVGKWLRIWFSGDLVLVTHMLMSGSWHVYRPGEKWQRPRSQMRIAIHTEAFVAVAFQVPVAEFHSAATLARHRSEQLGPDVAAADFDAGAAVGGLRSRPELEVGVALLSQSLMAGLGNVFKSEVCFAARVNPFRKVGTLSIAEVAAVVDLSRRLMTRSVAAGTRGRLSVYGRRGEACRVCGTAIESRKQGADTRVTFWCPVCQPGDSDKPV